jgi:predicted metal-binding membrane protein
MTPSLAARGERLGAFESRLLGVSGLLFVASAATTAVWCTSIAAMGMSMPGGWTMSMAWMRMPDQTWSGAAASFFGMWVVMMVAMMLPALVPALRRYAEAVTRLEAAPDGVSVGRLVTVAGAGYFSVWAAAGLVLFPTGATLAAVEMDRPAVARAVPLAIAAVLLIAGAWQFTAGKARALACCGAESGHAAAPTGAQAAWRHGLRLGVQCLRCCGNLMAVLVVVGVMDLTTMALVTAAITAERLAPAGARVAHGIGGVLVAAGVVAVARALAGA